MRTKDKKACACCRYNTLPFGSIYQICLVCGWQDDDFQINHPDFAGGANKLSLNDYRAKWLSEHHKDEREE
jgi:hypothetical protein